MKSMLYSAAAALVLLGVSCKKTYQCKDQAGYINGEVSAYSQAKANERCRNNGSLSATLKPKNAPNPAPPEKPACELNGTGTLIFTNGSDSVIKISVEGKVPPGFERVPPGEQVYTEVPAGKKYGFSVTHSGGNYTASWTEALLVEPCKETPAIIKL